MNGSSTSRPSHITSRSRLSTNIYLQFINSETSTSWSWTGVRIYIVILLALPGNSRLDSSHVGHNEWIEGSRYLITISRSFLIYHDDRRVTSPCHLHHVFSRPQTCFSSPLSILQSPRGTLVNFNSQIFYSLKLILSQRRIIPVARCCKTQKSRSPFPLRSRN